MVEKFQSLAEFAVTTAMHATLATTAAPKFSGVGEGAKEKKTLSVIDKIIKSANNFYNNKVTTEGRGRFPGQLKYDSAVGGYLDEASLKKSLDLFQTYNSSEGSKWASVFGTKNKNTSMPKGALVSTSEDTNEADVSGAEEFLNEFDGNALKSPFQDGHYIYAVLPGGGSGQSSFSPILYVADLESPKNFYKKLQP